MERKIQSREEKRVWKFTKLFTTNNQDIYTDGSLEKHKTRLVVTGQLQRKSDNYDRIYSRVVKRRAIRLLFSIAAIKKMSLSGIFCCSRQHFC